MEKALIWVHGDCLSPHNPALLAQPSAPALWVWDEALLASYGVTLKRIVFIYECLLELPVHIRRGEVATELLHFAEEHGATHILTTGSPSPRFAEICARLEQRYPVEVLPGPPFLSGGGRYDLKRFARYWARAQHHAFGDSG
ncbi:MAG: deoxyribodipyrimidine photo-lyase [Anaerolineae bacterium]|nr:deoxyribodipyrimidine photo-lyase [Anaerolineae bacterium]